MEPTKIPCLATGISAGLWVDLLPLVSMIWSASGGHRRDFMVGCPLAAAAVLSCKVPV